MPLSSHSSLSLIPIYPPQTFSPFLSQSSQRERERESPIKKKVREREKSCEIVIIIIDRSMVSLHTPLKTIKELENSAKKRKWEEEAVEELFEKPLLISSSRKGGSKSPKSMFDTELLHLETPLPLEWQRCLDIQVNPFT